MDDSSHPRSMLPQMQGTGLAGPSGAVLTASLLMLPVLMLKLRCLRLARWMSCRVPQGGLSVLSGSTRAGFSRSLLFCEGDRRNGSNPEFSAVFVFHEDALLGRILARKGARFGGDSKSEREMKTGHEGMTQLPASSFTHTLRTHERSFAGTLTHLDIILDVTYWPFTLLDVCRAVDRSKEYEHRIDADNAEAEKGKQFLVCPNVSVPMQLS